MPTLKRAQINGLLNQLESFIAVPRSDVALNFAEVGLEAINRSLNETLHALQTRTDEELQAASAELEIVIPFPLWRHQTVVTEVDQQAGEIVINTEPSGVLDESNIITQPTISDEMALTDDLAQSFENVIPDDAVKIADLEGATQTNPVPAIEE